MKAKSFLNTMRYVISEPHRLWVREIPKDIEMAAEQFKATLSQDSLWALNGRFERGVSLAVSGAVSHETDPDFPALERLYRVRSANATKPPYSYRVDLDGESCECPDHAKGYFCKHRIAAHIIEIASDSTVEPEIQTQPVEEPPQESIIWGVIRHQDEWLGGGSALNSGWAGYGSCITQNRRRKEAATPFPLRRQPLRHNCPLEHHFPRQGLSMRPQSSRATCLLDGSPFFVLRRTTMYQTLMPKFVTRTFRSGVHDRYLCQFRAHGQTAFSDDGKYQYLDTAMSFVSLVVRFIDEVAEGRVIDTQDGQIVFTCGTSLSDLSSLPTRIREIPAQYAQLAMQGFDPGTRRQRKKVQETFARLRQLHDELNAQLYTHPGERPSINSPADAAGILQCFLANLDHEEMWVIDLDTRNRVLQLVALYKGSVNSSQVRVAEVFRQAIVENAPAIIVAHNHPSSDTTPSPVMTWQSPKRSSRRGSSWIFRSWIIW
jgi:hypothetical protein